MYVEIRRNVYNELHLAPGICLTINIWTSQANQAYMSVTAHFVDLKNNKIKNFVLETKKFSGNHTVERIVERLNTICIDWSISDKIVCLVTDTCNTMRKVGKDFGKVSKVVEWDGLEQLMNILEPFEAATRKLASDSSPTISIVSPVTTTLITSLEYRDADSSFQKKVKDNLRFSIQERFEELYQDKLVLLDPRWKDFSFLNRSLYQSHNETLIVLNQLQAFDARNLAYLFLQKQFNTLFGNTSTASQSNVQQPEQKKKEFDLFDIMITNNIVTSTNSRDGELLMYENEREIYRNENPLEWWNANKTKFPTLSKLAFKYLCITGTSAPSERMFSTTGHLTSDRRLRLTPENADILLFLNKNS
ncbi:unnamed protein product [Rotaria sordida]|uniref:HAT C-terminal dimerisation domain-containing protein n=1 Tax=Rotaria sordida TaxID=392033 RepID=A0A819WPT8_9BILA|nr:unnamed protein product [Rotaria sordida]